MKGAIALITFLITCVGAILGVGNWVNSNLAYNRTVNLELLRIQSDYLAEDIDDDASRAHHYRQLSTERPLSHAEEMRQEYLQKQLERKYRRADMLDEAQTTLRAD